MAAAARTPFPALTFVQIAVALAAVTVLTRRKMQEELQLLWEELRFTLLFVTHSIEEVLVVGNRVGLLVENGCSVP